MPGADAAHAPPAAVPRRRLCDALAKITRILYTGCAMVCKGVRWCAMVCNVRCAVSGADWRLLTAGDIVLSIGEVPPGGVPAPNMKSVYRNTQVSAQLEGLGAPAASCIFFPAGLFRGPAPLCVGSDVSFALWFSLSLFRSLSFSRVRFPFLARFLSLCFLRFLSSLSFALALAQLGVSGPTLDQWIGEVRNGAAGTVIRFRCARNAT
eukprot:2448319-Rhodomonas_salina.2